MRALVAVLLGALGVVLIVAGVNGSAENLFTSLFGTAPKNNASGGTGTGMGSSTSTAPPIIPKAGSISLDNKRRLGAA